MRQIENFQKVSLAALTQRLGQVKCQGLPFLHSFTGCDTTSAFKGIGKKKGFDILCSYSAALPTFCSFYNTPFQNLTAEVEEFKTLRRFVILMYLKTSDHLRVNKARLDYFFKNNQNLESIPPTENALLEHCKWHLVKMVGNTAKSTKQIWILLCCEGCG